LAAGRPLGGLIGVASAGQTKEVTFVVTFKDGKSFVASSDIPTFQRLLSLGR
jgi:hypothetical protein